MHVFVIIEWSRFFPGNPAVSVFVPYHPLTSCQKSKRSYARFFRSRADGRTDGRTYRSLTSTEVENLGSSEPRLNARDSTLVVWIRLESYLCSYLNWRGKVEWKTALKTRHQGMQNHAILTNLNEWNDNESHFDYFGPFLHIIKLLLHEL